MKTKTMLVMALVFLTGIASYAQTITNYEYWFDTNYADRVNVTVSGAAILNINNSVNAESLGQGYHTFWFHTKSSDGKWSVPVGSSFIKGNNEIVAIEYWFDNDYSTKENLDLTPSQSIDYAIQLPVAGLSIGDHLISMCYVDNEQIRSVPVTSSFYYDGSVVGMNHLSNTKQLTVFPNPADNELWINGITEKSELSIIDMQGRLILTQPTGSQTENIHISGLPAGIYTIQIRNPKETKSLYFVKNK